MANRNVRIEWFGKEVNNTISLAMRKRVTVVTKFLQQKVRENISRSVTVSTGPRGGRVVTDRSKPGEFPKKDFGDLHKDIFGIIKTSRGITDGFVGSTLDYSVFLELSPKLNRAFLVPTLFREQSTIKKILTEPIR